MPHDLSRQMRREHEEIVLSIRRDLNALSLQLLEVFVGFTERECDSLSLASMVAESGQLEPLEVFQVLCSTWRRMSLSRSDDFRDALHEALTDEPVAVPSAA